LNFATSVGVRRKQTCVGYQTHLQFETSVLKKFIDISNA